MSARFEAYVQDDGEGGAHIVLSQTSPFVVVAELTIAEARELAADLIGTADYADSIIY